MFDINKLKDIREDNDMSQRQLAFLLNVNRSTYSLWELGINIIPLPYLISFSQIFDISIDYIFGLTKAKKGHTDNLNLKILGTNMKKVRLKYGLSEENIGSILNVSQACINKYEKGIICISTINIYNFVKYFNISMSKLLENEPVTE